MNKKGLTYFDDWAEIWSMFAIGVGVVIGIGLKNDFVIVLVTLLSGLAAGRMLWKKKKTTKFPFYLITLAYLFGFIIGTRVFGSFFNWRLIMFIFVCAIFVGFYLYEKEILNG